MIKTEVNPLTIREIYDKFPHGATMIQLKFNISDLNMRHFRFVGIDSIAVLLPEEDFD